MGQENYFLKIQLLLYPTCSLHIIGENDFPDFIILNYLIKCQFNDLAHATKSTIRAKERKSSHYPDIFLEVIVGDVSCEHVVKPSTNLLSFFIDPHTFQFMNR